MAQIGHGQGPESDEAGQVQPASKSPGYERYIKWGFLLAIFVAATIVYFHQRKGPPSLEEWIPLDTAQAQAKAENRPILVLVTEDPPAQTTKDMLRTTLRRPENKEAINKGRFIQARLVVESASSSLAAKYKITALPTMIILDADGKELNRRTGFIGEVAFRDGFLDCSGIERPQAPAAGGGG